MTFSRRLSPLAASPIGPNPFHLANALNSNEHSDRLKSGTAGELPPLFSSVSPGDFARICASARLKTFTRGSVLYIEGASVQHVSLITSGFVKTTMSGFNGAEVIFGVSGPGDMLGAEGLFTNGLHCTTGLVRRTCRALVWDALFFKSLMECFPVLHQNMVRIVGAELLELQHRFHEVATQRVAARLARQLVRLRAKMGEPADDKVEVVLTREELAQMTGTTLFTVSRLLSAWEARGIVKARRLAVTICDVQLLREISDFTAESKASLES